MSNRIRDLYFSSILIVFAIAIIFIHTTPYTYSATSTCNLVGFANFTSTGTPNNGLPFSALDPVTFSGGGEFRDWETSQDKTSESGTGGSNDFSSGCRFVNANAACPDMNCNPDCFEIGASNPFYCGAPTNSPPLNTCGTATTAFRGILDPMGNTNFNTCNNDGSDSDDFITFRVRLDGNPKAGSFSHLVNDIWQMVIDVSVRDSMGNLIRPQDGFNDFLVAVDGSQNDGTGNNRVDRAFIFFNNNGALAPPTCTTQCNTTGVRTQNCLDLNVDCFLVDSFTACGERLGQDGLPNTPGCSMNEVTANCNKSFTRTQIVVNPGTGGTQNNEFYLDIMIPIIAFKDQNGTRQIFCNTDINLSLSSSTTKQNTFLKDSQPDCNSSQQCNFGDTTPITLFYFSTESRGNQVEFNWTTGTETANAGFNLYYLSKDGTMRINKETIVTKVMDSLTAVDYSYMADVRADTFYIADVDVNNQEKLHGPFKLGESYGTIPKVQKINWTMIAAEHKLAKANRQNANKIKAVKKARNFLTKTSIASNAELPKINLLVKEDGIHRVTFQHLSDAGLDLSGVTADQIALTNRGVPVPLYIDPSGNGGGAVEFYGEAIHDSLYTDTNVYVLEINPDLALSLVIDNTSITNSKKVLDTYTETYIEDNNIKYMESARNGDPWYDVLLVARPSKPSSKVYSFNLDNMVGNKGIVQVEVNGPGDIPSLNPDHHITVSLNGVKIADELFEGFASKSITVDLNNTTAQLINGTNQLVITVPGDLNAPFDLVYIDKFSISYPRKPIAINDKLILSAKANVISVKGLSNTNVTAYRLEDNNVFKLTSLDIKSDGNGKFQATFSGKQNAKYKYVVSTVGTLVIPETVLAKEEVDINTGDALYLIISHPDFINNLEDLVSERETQYSVKVVDVEDIYAQYNYGIFNPEPIKKYIKHAVQNLGTRYILLVGADTYDYKQYLNPNSISFIPTIYAASEAAVQFAPSDPLLADIDGDRVQDAAIGRFPVSTLHELELIISKTLEYPSSGHQKTAVFAADKADGTISFSGSSDNLISGLPTDWNVNTAYIDDLGVIGAKDVLNNSINEGRAFTSYTGHSDRTIWTFDGLYNINDVAALSNEGLPTVINQYGCWNTYFVHHNAVSMAHVFLLNGYNGAAAVMGPSTRTTTQSDNALGQVTIRNIFEYNMPIGMAIMEAKQELKTDFDSLRDVMIGWVLLGDPALEIAD